MDPKMYMKTGTPAPPIMEQIEPRTMRAASLPSAVCSKETCVLAEPRTLETLSQCTVRYCFALAPAPVWHFNSHLALDGLLITLVTRKCEHFRNRQKGFLFVSTFVSLHFAVGRQTFARWIECKELARFSRWFYMLKWDGTSGVVEWFFGRFKFCISSYQGKC